MYVQTALNHGRTMNVPENTQTDVSDSKCLGRMASSGILRRVALVGTDVSEELTTSFIRVTRIGELGTKLTVTSNRRTLRKNTKLFSRSVRRVVVKALCYKPEGRGFETR
jgi:hypothetical protein